MAGPGQVQGQMAVSASLCLGKDQGGWWLETLRNKVVDTCQASDPTREGVAVALLAVVGISRLAFPDHLPVQKRKEV